MDDTLKDSQLISAIGEFIDELKARNAQLESELVAATKQIDTLKLEIKKAWEEAQKPAFNWSTPDRHDEDATITSPSWERSRAKKVMKVLTAYENPTKSKEIG